MLRVAELACEVAPADMVGITLLVDGTPATGVCSDPDAPEIDRAQYDTGQAIGILLSTGGRMPEEAFNLLVRASQRQNRKPRDVAEDIVRHTVERGVPAGSDSADGPRSILGLPAGAL